MQKFIASFLLLTTALPVIAQSADYQDNAPLSPFSLINFEDIVNETISATYQSMDENQDNCLSFDEFNINPFLSEEDALEEYNKIKAHCSSCITEDEFINYTLNSEEVQIQLNAQKKIFDYSQQAVENWKNGNPGEINFSKVLSSSFDIGLDTQLDASAEITYINLDKNRDNCLTLEEFDNAPIKYKIIIDKYDSITLTSTNCATLEDYAKAYKKAPQFTQIHTLKNNLSSLNTPHQNTKTKSGTFQNSLNNSLENLTKNLVTMATSSIETENTFFSKTNLHDLMTITPRYQDLLNKEFINADTNHDNQLTDEEIITFLNSYLHQTFFTEDTTHTDFREKEETKQQLKKFMAKIETQLSLNRATLEINNLDTNKDGCISNDEFFDNDLDIDANILITYLEWVENTDTSCLSPEELNKLVTQNITAEYNRLKNKQEQQDLIIKKVISNFEEKHSSLAPSLPANNNHAPSPQSNTPSHQDTFLNNLDKIYNKL